MPTPLTLEQMQGFITFINNAFAKRPYTNSSANDFNQGKVMVATGQGFGVEPLDIGDLSVATIKPWEPSTDFFADPVTDVPVLVHYDGSLYLADPACSTGDSFNERDGLVRISLDTDPVYLEITADATTPIIANQIIGRYASIRRFTVRYLYTLPNANLDSPSQYNKAMCNGSITTPTVVTLERISPDEPANAPYDVVCTITFTPNGDSQYTLGDFVFNDSAMGEGDEATGTSIRADELLVMRVTTVGTGLEWITINLLGEFISYTDPYYNIPV